MPSKSFVVPRIPPQGVRPDKYFGNGRDLTAHGMADLVRQLNILVGRRKKVLLSEGVEFGLGWGGESVSHGFYGSFRTSPEVGSVAAVVVCLPSATNSTSIQPRLQWEFEPNPAGPWDWSGGGGTAFSVTQPPIHVGRRKTTALGAGDIFWVHQKFDGSGGTTAFSSDTIYLARLRVYHGRVLAVVLYEEPRESMKFTTNMGVKPFDWVEGAPLIGSAVDAIGDRALQIHKKQAPVLFNWGACIDGVNDGTETYFLRPTAGATENVFDSSLSDWNANGTGFYTYPKYHGSYHTSNVPVVCWAVVSNSTNATDSTIYFRTAAGTNLATLTIPGEASADFQYYSATGNLDASQDTQKIDIICSAAAANTTLIAALGCYEYES